MLFNGTFLIFGACDLHGATRTPPKLGWNRGGVRSTWKVQNLWNGARWDQGYYYALIGSHIRAFVWHQNQWLLMTLNGQNVTLAEKKQNFRSLPEKFEW